MIIDENVNILHFYLILPIGLVDLQTISSDMALLKNSADLLLYSRMVLEFVKLITYRYLYSYYFKRKNVLRQ